MTVSSENNLNTYSGNGATTVFAYTFKILSQSEILVQLKNTTTGVITTQTITTHYTVSNVGVSAGGNITFVSAPASGYTVIISRNMAQTQLTDYSEYDAFPADSHETALDRLTMMVQELQLDVNQSVKFDRSVSVTTTVADLTSKAGYVLKVNSGETGLDWALFASTTFSVPVGTGIIVKIDSSSSVLRTLTGTSNEITVTNGDGVSGNPTISLPTSLTFTGKTITGGTFSGIVGSGTWTGTPTISTDWAFTGTPTFVNSSHSGTITITGALANTSLRVFDTDASHALKIVPGSNLTAERTLTVTTGDADRTLTLSGDVTLTSGSLSGTNTGDQTITLTGDITGTGTGTFATTYNGIVPLAKGGSGYANTRAPVNIQTTSLTSPTNGTSTIPLDITIPQNTEGTEILTVTITPKNANNILVIEALVPMAHSATDILLMALFQDSTADALNAVTSNGTSSGPILRLKHVMTAGTTSATTFKIRVGANAGTWYVNGGAAFNLGSVITSTLTVQEWAV